MGDKDRGLSRKFTRGAMLTLLLVVMAPQLGLSLITPSFSEMALDLGVSLTQLQWTTTVYMAGYAASMFLGGYLAEKYDAVKLQAAGLLIFGAGSLVCAVSPSLLFLALGRLLQALGGTSATVLCRLIVRRLIAPEFRVAPLANLTMVISLTPAVAPLLGGLASLVVPWRITFVILTAISTVFACLCWRLLGSAPPENPGLPSGRATVSAIAASLTDTAYLWYAAALALVWMSYFGFLALSPGFFEANYGITGISYGLIMLMPAVGYWFGSFLIKHASNPTRLAHLSIGLSGLVAFGVLLCGFLLGDLAAWAVISILTIQFVGVGATIPYSQNGQLALSSPLPGISTGLFFFIQMMSGAAYAAVGNSVAAVSCRSVLSIVAAPQILLGLMLCAVSLMQRTE